MKVTLAKRLAAMTAEEYRAYLLRMPRKRRREPTTLLAKLRRDLDGAL